MEKDPVMRELHEAKDKVAAKYGYSVQRLGRALIRKQEARKHNGTSASSTRPAK